ncbi:unnamed protein product, partial [Prunus brigantina]
MVRREAQRQITMLGSGTKIGEPAVMFASKSPALVSQRTRSGSSAVPLQTYYRHLLGKEWRRLKKEQLDSKAHVAVAPTSMADITTGHDHLTATPPTLTAVSGTPTPPPPDNFGKAFHAHDTRDTGWIIDSGATDHMTYNSALFSTTLPPHRDHVLTANNAAAPVTGVGSILLTPALRLDKVLLVPSLSSNLLSVPQVTEQLNCVVLIRVLRAGSANTSQHRRIWLLHYRFGHASFCYLRHLFPALFSGVNESDFQCQTCILAKSHQMIQTQFMLPIKVFRSDNGGEFVNSALSHFFHTMGVLHETTCPQTPQQNGVAERKNGQILAAARALLLGASVPKWFWMDAVTYAVYLLNRLPSRVLDFQTPMHVLTHHVSASSMLTLSPKVFGCVVYVHLHQNQRSKLDPCALRCVFLGFSPHQKGY